MNSRTKGFSIIEIIIAIVIIAIIGLLIWRVWDATQHPNATPNSSTQQTQNEIKSTDDLDKTNTSLDSANIDGDYQQQLDAETNF